MKNLRNMLFASLLALAISSTAFASNISTGKSSNISTGATATATSNISTGATATSNISTGLADLLGDIVSTFFGLGLIG
jgi:hypothetical protein